MLKHLSIQNFRGLRTFEADLDTVTVFLGPNSSGKTTVLHAIRLACELLTRALESERPARVQDYTGVKWIDVTYDTLLTDVAGLLSLADWRAMFVDQAVGERVASTITMRFEETDPIQELWTQVTCARNEQLKLDVSVRSAEALDRVVGLPKKSQHINRQLTEFLREHAPRAVLIPPFYGTVPAEELRSRAIIDRLLGSGDQSHVVRNLITDLSTEQFQRMSQFLHETLGARLTGRTSGDQLQTEPTLRVNFADSNGDLELSAAGAGLVNLAALYASLSRWSAPGSRQRALFLLDEPEAHLSPRVQADSAARLARLVTQDFSAQLIMATHSVDILNRLSEEGARLLRCDRNATPSVTSLESDASLFDDLARWVDLTPYTAINFLAARRLLFVEGRDELSLLPRLGELRFRHDPTRLRLFRRWSMVQLGGVQNQSIAPLLAQLVASEAIRTSAKNQGFEVLVVLDRDYERSPGFGSPEIHSDIQCTTLVWSRHSLESLLVQDGVLLRWVRAFLGKSAPADLETLIHQAILAADQDPALGQEAVHRYSASLIAKEIREGNSITTKHGRPIVDAMEQAQRQVSAEPQVWQKGKSRAQFILNKIRQALAPEARAHFPTDVVRLFERTDLNQLGDSIAPIPPEVNALLERMANPASTGSGERPKT